VVWGVICLPNYIFGFEFLCVGDWFYEKAMFDGYHNLFNDLALFDSD
jgi:hypothetical protein